MNSKATEFGAPMKTPKSAIALCVLVFSAINVGCDQGPGIRKEPGLPMTKEVIDTPDTLIPLDDKPTQKK